MLTWSTRGAFEKPFKNGYRLSAIRRPEDSLRIIAGKYRGRRLKSPPSLETRPTSDRLRETLFNILAPQIKGARFLDSLRRVGGSWNRSPFPRRRICDFRG